MQSVDTQRIETSNAVRDASLRNQLLTRRDRLKSSVSDPRNTEELLRLLHEVDAALERMESGTYGICETCHDSIENDRLLIYPLCRNCLDHLSAAERKAFERDLDLAYQVQRGLLPKPDLTVDGWQVAYHYDPAGSVSGDYCDIIMSENSPGSFYFLVGDVTGKGVAASLLMSHLNATFRSLVTANLPVHELVSRANRIFCEGTLTTHFATLVCGRADQTGEVEICNAGHCLPLHIKRNGVKAISSTGLPLGLVYEGVYTSETLLLEADDSLMIYTDGLSESRDNSGKQYGNERLNWLADEKRDLNPRQLIGMYLKDVQDFRADIPRADDLTIMVVRRGA